MCVSAASSTVECAVLFTFAKERVSLFYCANVLALTYTRLFFFIYFLCGNQATSFFFLLRLLPTALAHYWVYAARERGVTARNQRGERCGMGRSAVKMFNKGYPPFCERNAQR